MRFSWSYLEYTRIGPNRKTENEACICDSLLSDGENHKQIGERLKKAWMIILDCRITCISYRGGKEEVESGRVWDVQRLFGPSRKIPTLSF